MQPCEPNTPPALSQAQPDRILSVEMLLRHAAPPVQVVLKAIVAAQSRHELFVAGQPLIVAVSGGADSICLLHALHQLAPLWQLPLHVAHLDHALRPESAADADFVRLFAQQLQLPAHITRLPAAVLENDPRGLEAAGRAARYAFLRQVALQVAVQVDAQAGQTAAVATAHHQDDQAETLLLHLIQGSGLTGLAGMAWVSPLPDALEPPIRLLRPLLGIDRATVQNYLHAYELSWCEDASNQDAAYLRNQLRHQLLPSLAAINPNIHATLARTAELFAAEAEHANQRDRTALAAVTVTQNPGERIVLDRLHLATYDQATQRGVVRQALFSLGIDLRAVGMDGIDVLLEQSYTKNQMEKSTAALSHPLTTGWAWTIVRKDRFEVGHEGVSVKPTTYHLALHRAEILPISVAHPHLGKPLTTSLPLPSTGLLINEQWRLKSSLLDPSDLPAGWNNRAQCWQIYLDAQQGADLYLTTPQPGMRIAPLGMGGQHRNIGDIFTDHKIPTYLRPGWPVILKKNEVEKSKTDINGTADEDVAVVVWLCGLTLADSVRIHPATRQVRHLAWEQATS